MDNIAIKIIHDNVAYSPVITGDIQWTTERAGTPGKLTFDVVKDNIISFQEGDTVQLYVNDTGVFFGFVFIKKRSSLDTITITAYDQLRYLKNKTSYCKENFTATELINRAISVYLLRGGDIADTRYNIPKLSADGSTLFDIIQNALDKTMNSTGIMYVLYDNFGKLMLKNVQDMQLDVLVDNETAEGFDYQTSIDSDAYNSIRIVYREDESSKPKYYEAKDDTNIAKWGVLQYYEKANNDSGLQMKADSLLSMHNRKQRQLSIKGVFGDIRVHAGCSVKIALELGDINVKKMFVCEKVTHKFTQQYHSMDLTLRGRDFDV